MTNKVVKNEKKPSQNQNPQKETSTEKTREPRNGNKVDKKERRTFKADWAFAT
jgi:hypothetical protein